MAKKKNDDQGGGSLEEQLSKMRQEIEALTESMKKMGSQKPPMPGAESVDEGGWPGHAAWEDMQRIFEEVRRRGDVFVKDVTDEIERHPVKSAAVALGIGFLLAKLFSGRRS